MNEIYRVTVRGKRLESRDLRQLLARAVAEKRIMDLRLRLFGPGQNGSCTEVPFGGPAESMSR